VIDIDGTASLVDPRQGTIKVLTEGCHHVAVIDHELWAVVRPDEQSTFTDLRRIALRD
jgi:hypothetical protein